MKSRTIVEQGFVYAEETHLTVMKTSIFFSGDGFAAYDSKGEPIFRVDSYGPVSGDAGELVLMDNAGRSILTVRRKWPSLHQRWEGFSGDRIHEQKPIFSVRRSSMIGRSTVTVDVYDNRTEEYNIEGSFAGRNCTIFDSEKNTVAEIRRKVDRSSVNVMGKDVFLLSLKAGFDVAFAMGLVLILDQIYGDGDKNDENEDDDDENEKEGSKASLDRVSKDSDFM